MIRSFYLHFINFEDFGGLKANIPSGRFWHVGLLMSGLRDGTEIKTAHFQTK